MPNYQLGEIRPTLPTAGTYWIAPTAAVIGDVRLSPGASLWFGSVLRGDNGPIIIGEDSNIQDGCTLHSDPGIPLTIGAQVTVGHNVILHGCLIGDNSLIGMGAIILNNASVGRHCLIGAGALITGNKVIPDGSVVLGNPGKIVRQTSAEEIASIAQSALSYKLKWQRYRTSLKAC